MKNKDDNISLKAKIINQTDKRTNIEYMYHIKSIATLIFTKKADHVDFDIKFLYDKIVLLP